MTDWVRVSVLAGAVLTLGAAPAPNAALLKAIQGDLTAKGPAAVLKTYFNCDGGKGYALVETGDAAAVALAARLMKGADACYAEGVGSSLGVAMSRNPTAVLPLVNSGVGLAAAQICLPFLSAEDPPAKTQAALARTRAALAKVTAPALARQKAACLAVVAGASKP